MTAYQRAAFAAVLMAIVPLGCQTSFSVKQYPEFYTPQVKSVAVLPFSDQSPGTGAGQAFSTRLTAALKANGTYKVAGPADLRRGGFADLPAPATVTDPATVKRLGESGKYQAYITGRVLKYDFQTAQYAGSGNWPGSAASGGIEDNPPGTSYGDEGPRWTDFPDWDTWCCPYYTYVRAGHVEVEASIVSLPDGKVLYTTSTPVQGSLDLCSCGPGPHDVLMETIDQAVAHLLTQMAIVPVDVAVDPARDFRTAAKGADGQWQYSDRFRTSDSQLHVVLRLPPAADRNSFRLTVTPRGQQKVVASQDVLWSRTQPDQAVAFEPAKIGAGWYTARFYSQDKQVMTHDFRID